MVCEGIGSELGCKEKHGLKLKINLQDFPVEDPAGLFIQKDGHEPDEQLFGIIDPARPLLYCV